MVVESYCLLVLVTGAAVNRYACVVLAGLSVAALRAALAVRVVWCGGS